ncbi:hypothetical protein C8J57DRAFT_376751 [Mycena rebaudengoi]|nr:hypothetical protein C8J57DRAFT_376751 [Mycena rebaudengoi]
MRVPQEIVDAIIDNFAMSHDDKISRNRYWREPGEPVDADSLRACSLTSRSFLRRSRMHLFAAFFCQCLSDFSHFDSLLAESPHIGELYVRYFKMTIRDYVASLLTEDVVLPRILSRLPSLTHVARIPIHIQCLASPFQSQHSSNALTPLSAESLPLFHAFCKCLGVGVAPQPRNRIESPDFRPYHFRQSISLPYRPS